MTIHAWYSEKAYRTQSGFYYLTKDNHKILCTIVSKTKKCPYNQNSIYREDCEYLGKVKKFRYIFYNIEV
jgi:hypothetical protein